MCVNSSKSILEMNGMNTLSVLSNSQGAILGVNGT
jgi:hypothetical protein